jgi:hypothetical protein
MALMDEQVGVTDQCDAGGAEPCPEHLQDAGDSRTERDKQKPAVHECFLCGRTYLGATQRFCSERCREAFDDGGPSHAQQQEHAVRRPGDGVDLVCLTCRKKFLSHGFRCCSKKCEGAYRKQEQELIERRELGVEPAEKPKCAMCNGPMPIWRKGRRARADRRFCSDRCRQRSRSKSGVATPVSERRLAPGSGENNAHEMESWESTPAEGRSCLATPIDLLGGRRRQKGSLDADLVSEIIKTEIGERGSISREAEPAGSGELELPMAA